MHIHTIFTVRSLYHTDVVSILQLLPSLESPVVTVALSEILIGIGETTVMACSASGIPQPEIRWYKGNTSEAERRPTYTV